MTTTARRRVSVRRGAVVAGAVIAGGAIAALSPAGAALMWTGLCAGLLATVNGYGKTTSP
jgi:hypothetical protein